MGLQNNNIITNSELDSKLLEVIKSNFISVDNLYRQLECLHNITYYLKPIFMLPQFRSWAISPDFAYHLIQKIELLKPKHIVECGSGLSTLISRYVIKKNNLDTYITSIDHDPIFLNKTKSMIKQHNLLQNIDFIEAPLVDYKEHDDTYLWYDISKLSQIENISMVIIDGPPGKLCPFARYPALSYFYKKLNKNACIVLDDANRSDEKEIVNKWLAKFSTLTKEKVEHTEKGLVFLYHKI